MRGFRGPLVVAREVRCRATSQHLSQTEGESPVSRYNQVVLKLGLPVALNDVNKY